MRKLLVTAALAAVLAGPTLAHAAGPNGGTVTVADDHPIELVTAEREITFLIDGEDGRPMDTAGASGKAFVLAGGRSATVALKAAPPNRLVGTLDAPLPAGAKIVLSVKAHGHNLQARFER